MITEKQLKDKCTPDIIKKMCELAEGFEISRDGWFYCKNVGFNIDDTIGFPLLIHRAVSGWNKINRDAPIIISDDFITYYHKVDDNSTDYDFENYQPENLTACECAMLDCLMRY